MTNLGRKIEKTYAEEAIDDSGRKDRENGSVKNG
jgi:hypothetical protein